MWSILCLRSVANEYVLLKMRFSRVSNIVRLAFLSLVAVIPSYSVAATFTVDTTIEIGRASCRERVCYAV